MTNNDIIYESVKLAFSPDQLKQLVQAVYTAEQIEARRAGFDVVMEEASAESAEDILIEELAAETFHTFAEWKRMGYSVKKGAHAALICNLWKYTDKPGKAVKEAAAEAGKEEPEHDPHFYKARSHLFHRLQVEKVK